MTAPALPNVWVRPEFRVRGRRLYAYQLCGGTGIALAFAAAMAVALSRGLSPWLMAAAGMLGAAAFIAVLFATKIVTGEERIVNYHDLIAAVAVAALFFHFCRVPLRAYLDVYVPSLGLVTIFGRLGCFLVGCCHGLPCRFGIAYSRDHAAAGFPERLVGIRLFPLPLVEAAWLIMVTSVSLSGWGAGAYVLMHAAGRFVMEFPRGDRERPPRLLLSEAQWTSLLLIAAAVILRAR
jgi:hypothetical protein